jgi:LacI family transcriptional regulator
MKPYPIEGQMPQTRKNQPSIQDVAKLAGVSLGTVSNVLNYPDRVLETTVKKVHKAIDQLGFVRNDAARQLKAGKSKALGLVLLDSANPFFAQLARGAEDAAVSEGYAFMVANSAHEMGRETNYLKMFQEQRLSGVLVTPVDDMVENIRQLRTTGTQVVLVDRKANASLCCSVSVDDEAGGKMAVEHLLSQGRKKIAFVGGPLDIQQVADRLAGAKAAVRKSAQKATLKTYPAKAQDVLSGRDVGLAIAKEPKSTRPDAIFAANDLLALGILQAFVLNNKVQVPSEIAIIGYDDIDFAEAAVVSLSSIKQPAKELGETGLKLLLDEIQNTATHTHRQITFQPSLVIRDST